MNEKILQHPILEHGIRNINFFEGRLLTGEDLREQQNANREHDNRLGKAIGAGIIEGLEVELDNDGADGNAATVKVKKGLAINAKGEVFGLPEDDIQLALTETGKVVNIEEADFNNCTKLPGSQLLPNAARVYILVMSPAAGYKERAPKSGLGDDGVVKGCGSRYIQEGVEFRLVELTTSILMNLRGITEDTKSYIEDSIINNPVSKSDTAGLSRLRNLLSHLCFGTEQLSNYSKDPFSTSHGRPAYSAYGSIDALHELNELNDCDVPLALLYRDITSIAFCDIWSVRRFPYELQEDALWPTLENARRMVEAVAMLYQFQIQLMEIIEKKLTLTDVISMEATDYFFYLPAIGYLPLYESSERGIELDSFFIRQPHRDVEFIGSEQINELVHQALGYTPVKTSEKEMVWVYRVWQNAKGIEDGDGYRPYLIFTSGHVYYQASARFDVARWDYSNYTRF